jgi:hypothetical protein
MSASSYEVAVAVSNLPAVNFVSTSDISVRALENRYEEQPFTV